jgi:hypothetical protein
MFRSRSFVSTDVQQLSLSLPGSLAGTPRTSAGGPPDFDEYTADKDQTAAKTLRRYLLAVHNLTSQRAGRIALPLALVCLVLLAVQHLLPGTQVRGAARAAGARGGGRAASRPRTALPPACCAHSPPPAAASPALTAPRPPPPPPPPPPRPAGGPPYGG